MRQRILQGLLLGVRVGWPGPLLGAMLGGAYGFLGLLITFHLDFLWYGLIYGIWFGTALGIALGLVDAGIVCLATILIRDRVPAKQFIQRVTVAVGVITVMGTLIFLDPWLGAPGLDNRFLFEVLPGIVAAIVAASRTYLVFGRTIHADSHIK